MQFPKAFISLHSRLPATFRIDNLPRHNVVGSQGSQYQDDIVNAATEYVKELEAAVGEKKDIDAEISALIKEASSASDALNQQQRMTIEEHEQTIRRQNDEIDNLKKKSAAAAETSIGQDAKIEQLKTNIAEQEEIIVEQKWKLGPLKAYRDAVDSRNALTIELNTTIREQARTVQEQEVELDAFKTGKEAAT